MIRLHPRETTVYINHSRTVWATQLDGFVDDHPDIGLFFNQARLLSLYRYSVNDRPFEPVGQSSVRSNTWMGYYIARPPGLTIREVDAGSGRVPPPSQQSLELRLSRRVGTGFHEDVDVVNYSQQATSFHLNLDINADFADAEETHVRRIQKGKIRWTWKKAGTGEWNLRADYRIKNLWRGFVLRFLTGRSAPTFRKGRISIPIKLASQQKWRMCVELIPHLQGKPQPFTYDCYSFGDEGPDSTDRKRKKFLEESAFFSVPGDRSLAVPVVRILNQAKADLASLRLYDLDTDRNGWTMAAGLPVYIALFGRDVLTAGWQAAVLSSDMMEGALLQLAHLQGKKKDDWRDEQPGRMLHEAHTGPLAELNLTPRSRYYGAATTSAFYPVILSEVWHWTGNKELILPLIKPALDALEWLENYSDLENDGFYEYKTRSRMGVKNQGWKDSSDAIVYPDGSQVQAPIATCEEQAFVYVAKLQLSEVLWWMDRKDLAKRLYHEASELKKRFNDVFWVDKENFFAMGLDSKKRPIASAGSNPGHCLAAGLVDKSLVRKTIDRLMKPDLFSGWGVRTLSSDHPAYNPYSYHRGSVWPVEQGTFALGFMRYGFFDKVDAISRAQMDLAGHFDYGRLPELISGHPRNDQYPFPAFYPNLNWPQAWSSSAMFTFMQSLLGLYPYAPLHTLMVDPHLPEWLPDLTLQNLRVGEAQVSLRFWRTKKGASDYQVLNQTGRLHVIRQPSPWSMTAQFAERLKDVVTSFLPGKSR